jgi:hypothetical protein
MWINKKSSYQCLLPCAKRREAGVGAMGMFGVRAISIEGKNAH